MNGQKDLIVEVKRGYGWYWVIKDFQNKHRIGLSFPNWARRADCLKNLRRITLLRPPNKHQRGPLKWRARRP